MKKEVYSLTITQLELTKFQASISFMDEEITTSPKFSSFTTCMEACGEVMKAAAEEAGAVMELAILLSAFTAGKDESRATTEEIMKGLIK